MNVFHHLQKDKQCKQRHSLKLGKKTREFQTQLLHYFSECDNKSNHHHIYICIYIHIYIYIRIHISDPDEGDIFPDSEQTLVYIYIYLCTVNTNVQIISVQLHRPPLLCLTPIFGFGTQNYVSAIMRKPKPEKESK